MAKIKNVSGEDLLVPWLGGRLVLDGQEVEVPDEDADAYLSQPGRWESPEAPAKRKPKGDTNDSQEG